MGPTILPSSEPTSASTQSSELPTPKKSRIERENSTRSTPPNTCLTPKRTSTSTDMPTTDPNPMEKHSTEPGSQSWANSSMEKRTNSKTTRGSMETRATLSSTRASQLSIRPKISSRNENVQSLAAI